MNFMVTPLRDIFSSPADERAQQANTPAAIYNAAANTKIPTRIINVFIHLPPIKLAYQFKLLPQWEQYLFLESFFCPQT